MNCNTLNSKQILQRTETKYLKEIVLLFVSTIRTIRKDCHNVRLHTCVGNFQCVFITWGYLYCHSSSWVFFIWSEFLLRLFYCHSSWWGFLDRPSSCWGYFTAIVLDEDFKITQVLVEAIYTAIVLDEDVFHKAKFLVEDILLP